MKTRRSALAAAISSISTVSLLTGCNGGGGSSGDISYPVPPTVTVTAPARVVEGDTLTVSWVSDRTKGCNGQWDSELVATSIPTSGSVSVAAPAQTSATYTVNCTGDSGRVRGSATTQIQLYSTAEGWWNGTTGSGSTLQGVVTHEGKYWLAYSAAGAPVGFYAGSGESSGGSFPSSDLQEYKFGAGGGTKQGTLASTYTQSLGYTTANTLAGAFNAITGGTVYDLTMSASVYFSAANGPLNMIGFTGTYDTVANTGSWSGTTTIPGFSTIMHYTQTFTMDETKGVGKLNQLTNCTDNTGSACAGFAGPLQGTLFATNGNQGDLNTYKTKVPFTPADGFTTQFTLQTYLPGGTDSNGQPLPPIYAPMPMDVTLHAKPTSSSITGDTFTSNYNPVYEETPSVNTVAANYTTGYTGINTAMNHDVSLTIAADGSITGSESNSHCGYAGTIAAHAKGNVYDVNNVVFSDNGGSCVYTGKTFNGAATYDDTTRTLTITAVVNDANRTLGFMVVAQKP